MQGDRYISWQLLTSTQGGARRPIGTFIFRCADVVLMSLVWFVMLSVRPDPGWRGGIRTRWLLPFLLGMLQLCISMMTLYRPVLRDVRDVPEASVSMLKEPHLVADRRAGIRQAKGSESIYTAVHGRQ